MELLEGEDLESYLARHGKLSERQIADLALPIIAAIGAVHDAGVVHRDIKPSNIFLAKGTEEDLVPKVLDFGISKSAKPLGDSEFVATGPGDLVGTPLYISPEALKGAQHLTTRSDQYSLAVVLYQCAVGRRPHEAKDLPRLVRSILSEPVQSLRTVDPSLSPALEAAVMRALSRNPEERFEHVRDLGAALWSLASQRTRHVWAKRFSTSLAYTLPFDAQPEPPAPSSTPRRELRPLWAGLAAATAVLGAGYLVSITWPPARPQPASASNAAALQRTQAAILPKASGPAQSPPPSSAATPTRAEAGALPSASGGNGVAAAPLEHVALDPPAQGAAGAEARPGPIVAAVPSQPAPTSPAVALSAEQPLTRSERSPPGAPPRRAVAARPVAPSPAAASKLVTSRATGGAERRTPGAERDDAPTLLRAKPQPVGGERPEPTPEPPRGANQSPILD
jgi:serine/threonine-protein kinase